MSRLFVEKVYEGQLRLATWVPRPTVARLPVNLLTVLGHHYRYSSIHHPDNTDKVSNERRVGTLHQG